MADPKIRITADTGQAERAINDLEKALGNLNDQAADVAKFFGVLSAAAATVAYTVVKTVDAAGALTDAAKLLNVSTGQLQQLHYAAQLAGVGADEFNGSLVRLNRNLGEGIAKGSGPAVDAMNRLGLNLQQISGLNPDQQFKRIAEQLALIPNYAERSALAMDLFGKQGPRILAVADELEKVRSISEQIGFGISDREIAALDEASDALDQLKIIWDAGIKKAVAEIAPYVVAIVNEIKRAIAEAGGFEAIWGKITEAIRSVINVLLVIGAILVGRLVVGALAFTVQLGKALATARGLSAVLARTPIGLLAVAAGILAEKFGVDLVGGAGEFLDINLDIAAAQKQIDDALADHNTKINSNVEAQGQYNEEQRKALEALAQTATALGIQNQYLKDILDLGQQEADVRKLIRDETEKLKKVGLEMTPQQENMLRLLKEEEASVKRITTLRKEQGQAAYDALRPQTTVGQEYEKLLQARRQFEQGLTKEERDALNQREAMAIAQRIKEQTGMDVVLYNATQNAKMAVANEVAKYNRFTALDVKYQKDKEQLNDIIQYHEMGLLDIGQKNYETVLATRKQLDVQYAMEKMQLESEAFANFSRFEDMKIQREAEVYAERLRMQKDFMGNAMFSNEQIKQIAAERAAFERKTTLEQTKFGLDQAQVVFASLGAQNKKAFEASKALAVASAVMNTYQGATKALATYPWPFGLIAAAAAVAAGFAQVNAIKSQQYSGKMVGGAVAGAGSYIVGEKGPELFTPGVTGNITPNHQMNNGSTNVNFTIVANDTAGFDELLTSRRGVITQIISDAMLERGQRM